MGTNSSAQAHTLERLGGLETRFWAREPKFGLVFIKQTSVQEIRSSLSSKCQCSLSSTVTVNQGVTGERNWETSKCHIPEYFMLATRNETTCGLFLFGRVWRGQATSTLCLLHTSLNSANESLLRNRLLYPHNLICMSGVSLYRFYEIVSCSKSQDAKVADDHVMILLNAEVNQPFFSGHSWVPMAHTGEHQAAWRFT